MLNLQQTIVAGSSPPGRSLRALVRLSGPDASSIAAKLANLPDDSARPERQAYFVHLDIGDKHANQDPSTRNSLAASLPALAASYLAPHSYTGQDLIEIQIPGNPALLDRLIHRAIDLGARLAEPGEFTFRAFVAGKIDLTQAEGVAATVAAISDAQLQAAKLLRQGKLGQLAGNLVEALANKLALVEAGIDFTDQEDVVPIGPAALDRALGSLVEQLQQLLQNSRPWGQLEDLPRIVLVGPASSGKSSLFNALIGQTRAVISDLPGTTRDVLAEPLKLNCPTGQAIEVMLVDIAGLDTPFGALDRQIQDAADQAISQADLIILLDDGRETSDSRPAQHHGRAVLHVKSKADLQSADASSSKSLHISALTGQGLDQLRSQLVEALEDRAVGISSQMLALGPRHEQALNQALHHLIQTRKFLVSHLSDVALDHPEIIADGMRAALDELACLGGQMTADDVIGRIFANFCVGK